MRATRDTREVHKSNDSPCRQSPVPDSRLVLCADASHPGHQQVEEVLGSVGFTEAMQAQPVASLSGGWKMKLALARAMLMKADIMLLDEPTNHLDVKNVKWLQDYLISLTEVTSMIVSHDSGFLDAVCSNIIHYEGRKLRLYRVRHTALACAEPQSDLQGRLGEAACGPCICC